MKGRTATNSNHMSTALTNANGFDIHKQKDEQAVLLCMCITMRFGVIIMCLQSSTVFNKPTPWSIWSVSIGLGHVLSQI